MSAELSEGRWRSAQVETPPRRLEQTAQRT
jgi:hypothetical protein